MLPIAVLCSHCIKMGICYSRIFRSSSSGASKFLRNEFRFIFSGLADFMNSASSSISTVWQRRRSAHISRIWLRTVRIGKYSKRRRPSAYTGTSRGFGSLIKLDLSKPTDRPPGNRWRITWSGHSVSAIARTGRSKAIDIRSYLTFISSKTSLAMVMAILPTGTPA